MCYGNPNCDGSANSLETHEVRLYPLGGGGNLILCYQCFAHENRYRRSRGAYYGRPEDWPQVDWTTAEVYP
jgi:hypothetical protein